MPTTVSSLLVFVAFLTPGFVYLTRTESRVPGQRYSALRETGAVVSASIVTNVLVLGLFGTSHWLWPNATPDLRALLRGPGVYLQSHYVEVALWSVGLLGASVGLAAVFAVPPAWIDGLLSRFKFWSGSPFAEAIARRHRNPIRRDSGWGTAFHDQPDFVVHLGLGLKDGTYLFGPLHYFNPQIEESGNRSLQLRRPIQIQTPQSDKVTEWDVDLVIVSADEIKTVSVKYLPESADC